MHEAPGQQARHARREKQEREAEMSESWRHPAIVEGAWLEAHLAAPTCASKTAARACTMSWAPDGLTAWKAGGPSD